MGLPQERERAWKVAINAPLLHHVVGVFVCERVSLRRLSIVPAIARAEPVPDKQRAGDLLRRDFPDGRAHRSVRRRAWAATIVRDRLRASGGGLSPLFL